MISRLPVVLLGPPGSGKSAVGMALARRGLRWRDWEMLLLERWGSTQNFAANKSAALTAHHDELRAFIDAPGAAAVMESTGLSDAAFLDALATRKPLVVRLDVSADEALRRIDAREPGHHFSDDVELNRMVWGRFYELVAPARSCELTVDTELISIEETAGLVLAALAKGTTTD